MTGSRACSGELDTSQKLKIEQMFEADGFENKRVVIQSPDSVQFILLIEAHCVR